MSISWAAKKQLTYLLIFLIVIVGIIFAVWLKASAPTCFDNKKTKRSKGLIAGVSALKNVSEK